MAQTILGDEIFIVGATYDGANRASGIYNDVDNVSGDFLPSQTGVILSTGRASSITNTSGEANQRSNTSTDNNTNDGDADFNALAGRSTFDAAFLEIDFIPPSDVNFMSMQFLFSSDEYPEYSASIYNDLVGVWVNGTLVPLAIGTGQTSVTNVNENENLNLYQDNTADQVNTEMDGFTVTMTLTIPVNGGSTNSIKIGIADASDGLYDSNLIIAAESLQTDLVAIEDTATIGTNFTKTFDILGNDLSTASGVLEITHINGIDISTTPTVTLANGQTVTANADGTLTFTSTSDLGDVNFTYTIEDENGITDVGFVTVGTIPCFVAGTLIRTPEGDRPVEDLVAGDMVDTHDNGPQALCWVGRRRVHAEGDLAPVRIAANTFGQHDTLRVSPQHRVLMTDSHAALLFGESEVLVAAKELINDRTVRPEPGGTVDYVHLLFEEHQVIYSNGLATESFLPGPMTLSSFEQDAKAEISALFPELDTHTGLGYGEAARPMLRGFETRLLFAPNLD